MSSPSRSSPHTTNRVVAIGTLDHQRHRGREATRLGTRNALRGREEQIVLQVPSPFGQLFALPLRLEGSLEGADLLDAAQPGTPLRVAGRLQWTQRDQNAAQNQGAGELTFRVAEVGPAVPPAEPGCDVWVSGAVLYTPRIARHPYRRTILLAQTALHVSVERQRRESRMRIVETERVPVVIPLDHPDAPNLLRPGNQVALEGMLERVRFERRGPQVEQSLAELEAEWQAQRAALEGRPDELRAAERRFFGRRRDLTGVVYSRVVAGYAELLAGTPASLREAQELRQAFVRRQQREGPDGADTRRA